MAATAGVRFTRSGEVTFYDSGDLDLKVGDWVVVESNEGPRVAWVVVSPSRMIYAAVDRTLPQVLRIATPEDFPTPPAFPGQGQRLVVVSEGEETMS